MVSATTVVASLGAMRLASAQAVALAESDAVAQSLGYREDAAKVDASKFAKYAPGQGCANCVFYQGKGSDPSGPCPLFGGKLVKAQGWCNSYTRKG